MAVPIVGPIFGGDGGGSSTPAEKRNLSATTPPTVNADASAGYSALSLWVDTVGGEIYRCLDATEGAAVWVKTTLTLDELGGLALQNPDAVELTGGTTAGVDLNGGGVLRNVSTFSASGTWTKPAWCRAVRVRVVGGGGGGGGAATTLNACAGGGGGGGFSEKWIVAPGASETVTVGAGGVGGPDTGGAGSSGGASSFGTHCSATGGAGGGGSTSTGTIGGGAGGLGSGGHVNCGGSGGLGGASGALTAGAGGSSMLGGGAQQPISFGFAGSPYGGGGSGARQNGTDRAGGAGAAGVVIVEEYA